MLKGWDPGLSLSRPLWICPVSGLHLPLDLEKLSTFFNVLNIEDIS